MTSDFQKVGSAQNPCTRSHTRVASKTHDDHIAQLCTEHQLLRSSTPCSFFVAMRIAISSEADRLSALLIIPVTVPYVVATLTIAMAGVKTKPQLPGSFSIANGFDVICICFAHGHYKI